MEQSRTLIFLKNISSNLELSALVQETYLYTCMFINMEAPLTMSNTEANGIYSNKPDKMLANI